MKLLCLLKKWNANLLNHAEVIRYPYVMFGWFGVITYPLYYVLWLHISPQGYESIGIRLFAVFLCSFLIIKDYWPEFLKPYLVIYWYAVMLYCLPFFFTFMTLANDFSVGWLMNGLTGVVLSILLLDLTPLFILLPMGVFLACWVFHALTGSVVPVDKSSVAYIQITYTSVIVFGALFARHKQKLQNRDMLLAKQKELANKAKNDFIANMSHDLRTPMTGVLGMFEELGGLAKDVLADPGKAVGLAQEMQEFVRVGKGSTNELLNMFNDILDAIKLDSNQMQAKASHFSLIEKIESALKLLKSAAQDKSLGLKKHVSGDVPPYFLGGGHNLDRILSNLVGNALKFTKEGHVEVSAELASDGSTEVGDEVRVRVCVSDTGIGIPKDKQESIFDHFSRINPSYEGNYKGNGLGLYAVKQYVESMNGSISVESEEGKGSRFIVELPFKVSDHSDQEEVVEPLPPLPSPESGKKPEPIKQDITQQEKGNPTQHASATKPSAEIVARVLVVEDNFAAAMSIQRALKRLNCAADHAKTGEESIDFAKNNTYDIIFMDIGLPGISGLDATKQIRGFSSVPIIAVTGHVDKAGVCIDAGMQELLAKPATPSSLEAMLNRHVHSKDDSLKRLNDGQTIIDWPCCVKMHEGDPEIAKEILDMINEEVSQSEKVIDAAYEQQNGKRMRDELHKMRGGVCYLRLPQLERALKDLHLTVKENPIVPEDLAQEYQGLKRAIKAFKEAYAAGDYQAVDQE